MVYIKGLKFRGFKSFRRAEASFPKGYVCLAGPNGSGKSNVTDGIRFALGEASLKALRAKKVSELINTSCKFAEVTLFIDGERQYEIKRAINSEGKTLYRINGKRSTRTLVMEELRQYGLEAGSHNIIAQGQVQKIVEMSAKERRQIIDSVAGISEFDAKKDEAMRELSKVEQKITEASIVLGERQTALNDLEKEKDSALSYLAAQDNFKRAMASMANSEYTRLGKSHAETIHHQSEISDAKGEIAKQSGVLNNRLGELESQRSQIVQKIGSSESREAALAEIEQLKVALSADAATLNGRKKEHQRLVSDEKTLQSEIERFRKSHKEMSGELSGIENEISIISLQISEFEKKAGTASREGELQSKLEAASEKIASLKERKAGLEASLNNTGKMLDMRKVEKERLASTLGEAKEDRLSGEMAILKKEVLAFESALEELFSREREINRSIPELEKRLFSLKDKAATLRATLSPAATSLALRVVDELRNGGMKGIYGTVSSLMGCDPKYNAAVEAAAGMRLNYVVVDRMDTAVKVIEKLKEQKSGRCTFLPLDTVKAQERASGEKAAGCLGQLITFIDFDAAFNEAMAYVFSDTLLFDTVSNAKKAGIGRARMVTLEGELLEKSGIITGGAQRGSLLSRSGLEKAEAEADSVKKDRDALFSQLYSIRDEMAAKRKEKASAEVRLRGIEIEAESSREKMAASKKTLSAIKEIESSMAAFSREIAASKAEHQSLAKELEAAMASYGSLKELQSAESERARQAGAESQKRLLELHASRSSLEAKLTAKKSELGRMAAEQSEKESKKKEGSSQLADIGKEISALEEAISKNDRLRAEKESKLAEMSSASKKLMSKLGDIDSQVKDIGVQIGRVRAEEEKKSKELLELEVKRQTTETRLSDLKATLEQYAGVATIDATKTELEGLANSSRATMEGLGNVNLRAPDLYEEKKRDIGEIRSRVQSLDTEKKAVFSMMDEIEGKKRAIFLSTFTSVNDNFKRLFGYIFSGEGTLLLEQPSSPFESGLLVKVREGGRDKYLDSMSGGEKSLLALIFIFAIQMHKAAPFYILDEADAALDKENSKKLADLIAQLASNTQFIVVTHNDTVLSSADVALGVTRTDDGSKIVGVQLTSSAMVAKPRKAQV